MATRSRRVSTARTRITRKLIARRLTEVQNHSRTLHSSPIERLFSLPRGSHGEARHEALHMYIDFVRLATASGQRGAAASEHLALVFDITTLPNIHDTPDDAVAETSRL